MRFLPQEHAAFIDALRNAGYDPTAVLFIKRRGRLHVGLPGRSGAFAFFREKTTTLDAEGRWQDRVIYYTGMDKKVPCQWEVVRVAFRAWLAMGASHASDSVLE